jgi:hypothetical protein
MITKQLPDGRWAATVKPRPWATVTAYGASEAEAIENAQRVEAALQERQA